MQTILAVRTSSHYYYPPRGGDASHGMREEYMLETLEKKYCSQRNNEEHTKKGVNNAHDNVRMRLVRFFKHHNPQKLAHVEKILKVYSGKEEAMFQSLVGKYGPEPDPLQNLILDRSCFSYLPGVSTSISVLPRYSFLSCSDIRSSGLHVVNVSTQQERDIRLLGIAENDLSNATLDFIETLCCSKTQSELFLLSDEKCSSSDGKEGSYVFLKNPSKSNDDYVCLNIALVENGWARFSEENTPSHEKEEKVCLVNQKNELHHAHAFRQAQIDAKRNKAGNWIDFDGEKKVFVAIMTFMNDTMFHTEKDCVALMGVEHFQEMTLDEGIEKGYIECQQCSL